MANKKKTIGEWVDSVFGKSYKTISEKLSVEEHDHFIQEATELQAQVMAQEGEESEEDSEKEESEKTEASNGAPGTPKQDSTEGGNNSATDMSIEQRLSALEASLKKEQTAKAELQTKLTQTETQLKASQQTNKKLRQSVNPLGEQDAAQGEQADQFLTKTDIEAREARKANQED